MIVDIFDQRDRWLEELDQYVKQDAQIICEAGYMSLPAIAAEISDAAHDSRPHEGKHKNDWISRARDLADTLAWLGPELGARVGAAVGDLHTCITTELLTTNQNGTTGLNDNKRPAVATRTTAVLALLDHDDVLVAAWRDLIAACKDVDHTINPVERVKYLRDTLFALCSRRKQDPGPSGPLRTAYRVLLGYDGTVRDAQLCVGDDPGLPQPDGHSMSPLSPVELGNLAERCIVESTPTDDFVIWFRIARAFVKGGVSVSHGAVTFYTATTLARALTDHDAAREVFDVVPEELLTDAIRECQLSDDDGPDEAHGFEHIPALVYARVQVHAVERHLATHQARTLLDAILRVNGTPDGTWRVLRGSLIFGAVEPTHYPRIGWGLKEPLVHDNLDFENDSFTRRLADLADQGVVITAAAAERLLPALQLQEELTTAADANAEAVVRAAVRAIEHCNAQTEHGLLWPEYMSKYLVDYYTVQTFAFRAVTGVFSAVIAHIPDHSPGAPPVAELANIAQDIREDGSKWLIIRAKTVAHIPALRRIYQDHWLARSLAELDDTLASPGSLSAAFTEETARVEACTARLRRTRNAAIHGSPLSPAACATIAVFARHIAGMALSNVIEAQIAGASVGAHSLARATRYQKRVENLTVSGDVQNLFALPAAPVPPPAAP